MTQLTYERGSVSDESWLMVALLVDTVDEQTSTVVVSVGGGGEGPFKMEDVSIRRLREGEKAVGQAGRFGAVLQDVKQVCDELALSVETTWESEPPESIYTTLKRELFDP
ncbi:hypothetical protein ACOZ4I_13360 [Haloarcula salina]|uniref:hypothetical protein n=1 Tax=Haloarcula salina TaxID=1429914 RepID=UPI003C701488